MIAAGVALTGLLVGPNLPQLAMGADGSLYSEPWLNLPILFGAATLSAVAFAALCVYFKGFAQLIVIAVGLLALAWWERSVLLGVVATLFTVVSVPANHSLWNWDLPTLFGQLGWHAPLGPAGSDAGVNAWQTLLVPGLVLVAGGAIAVLTRHTRPARARCRCGRRPPPGARTSRSRSCARTWSPEGAG